MLAQPLYNRSMRHHGTLTAVPGEPDPLPKLPARGGNGYHSRHAAWAVTHAASPVASLTTDEFRVTTGQERQDLLAGELDADERRATRIAMGLETPTSRLCGEKRDIKSLNLPRFDPIPDF